MQILLAAILLGASVAIIFWYFGASLSERRMMKERLKKLRGYGNSGRVDDRLMKMKFQKLDQRAEVKHKGESPQTILIILIWLFAGAFILHQMHFPVLNGILVLGIIPVVFLRFIKIASKRAKLARIERELPGALDLMVVCLEAGLGINSALLRVSSEMEDSPLGRELKRVADEVSAGMPIEEALRSFAKRAEAGDVNTIVSAIIQAQKMGSGLALTFRVQAESLREKVKTRIKEKIHKIPVKILFPLVFFIFPALFVVILGPAFINISETLKSVSS